MSGFDAVREGARRILAATRNRLAESRNRARNRDDGGRPELAAGPAGTGVPAAEPVRSSAATAIGTELSEIRTTELAVPRPVRVAAAWSWRLGAIVIAAFGLLYLLGYLSAVVIPAVIALLLAALLQPGAAFLRRHGVPRSLAAAIMLVTGIVVVSGVLTGVVTAFINGFPELSENVVKGVQQIQGWLHTGPLHLSGKQLTDALDTATQWVKDNRERLITTLTGGALATATTVGEVLVDMFLILFTTFFLVRDGRLVWGFLLRLFLPRAARPAVDHAGTAAWRSLVSYVRATVLVATIDAVGIGIGIVATRVPFGLAIPLAALIFLGAFIPIVGATVSGVVAVLVTLVVRGPIAAIVVLAVVLGVQQIESHLLQPIIMGRAVAIHPLGVILGIATGIAVAGIIGGLIAVPLIAVLNTAVRRLVAWQHPAVPPAPDPPPVPAK